MTSQDHRFAASEKMAVLAGAALLDGHAPLVSEMIVDRDEEDAVAIAVSVDAGNEAATDAPMASTAATSGQQSSNDVSIATASVAAATSGEPSSKRSKVGTTVTHDEWQKILDSLNPDLLQTIPDIGLEAKEDVVELRQKFTVLLLGFMGSGKTSLINALIGEPVLPMCAEQDQKSETDTMCLVEFCNDPYCTAGQYWVDIIFKAPHVWHDDWTAFLQTVKPSHFNAPIDPDVFMAGEEDGFCDGGVAHDAAPSVIGVKSGTDMLRALHPLCFQPGPAGDEERGKVLRYVSASDDAAVEDLVLAEDPTIEAIRARGRIELKVSDVKILRNLLSRLCRALSSEDAECEESLLNYSAKENIPELRDLLALGDPWPLIRIVSVRANVQNGELPPFCRLIDSPGLGGNSQVTGVETLSSITGALFDRQLSEVWYVQRFERNMASATFRDDMLQLKTTMGLECIRFVITMCDKQQKLRQEQHYKEHRAAKVRDIIQSAGLADEIPMYKQISKCTHYVSAMIYAVDKKWTWFPGVQERSDVVRNAAPSTNTSPVARLDLLFEQLRGRVWSRLEEIHAQLRSVIENLIQGLCNALTKRWEEVDPSQEGITAPVTFERPLECPAVKENLKQLEDSIQKFAKQARRWEDVRAHSAQIIAFIVRQLFSFRPQTVKAILGRGGRFKGVDIGELVWVQVLKLHFPGAKTFPDEVQILFQAAQKFGSESLLALMADFCKQMSVDSVFAEPSKRKFCSRLLGELQKQRQALTTQVTVGDCMYHLEGFARVWADALERYQQVARNKKQAAIKRLKCDLETNLEKLIKLSVEKWLKTVKMDVISAVKTILIEMSEELELQLQRRSSDARHTLEALMDSPARTFLSPETSETISEALKKAAIATAERPPGRQVANGLRVSTSDRLQDQRWILCEKGRAGIPVDSVLLFRGLASVTEEEDGDDEDDTRLKMLVPHQVLLNLLVTPADSPHAPLADALASSSSAALVEAILRARQPQLNPASLAQKSDDIEEELNSWTEKNLVERLSVEEVSDAVRRVRRAVMTCDDLTNSTVDQRTWQRYFEAWSSKSRDVDVDRQEFYSNDTKKFLHLAEVYLKRHKAGKTPGPDCPLGALDGGAEIRAWFHWRWLLAEENLLLPHMQDAADLHVNPFVSTSQGLEHALRYAAGLKNYRTGQELAVPLHIRYNSDLTLAGDAGGGQKILGVVVVYALSAAYVKSDPKVHVVLQMLEQNLIKLKGGRYRIGGEEEVTLYGGMPSSESRVLLRWPLLLPNLATHNAILRDCYGITADSNQFFNLKLKALDIVNAPDDEQCQRRFRAALAVAAGKSIVDKLLSLQIVVPFDQRVVSRE